MAAKTGPLGIRYSPWSLIFTVVVLAVAYEITAPAAWQLVGALPKAFIVAAMIVGSFTILTAFLSDNLQSRQLSLKLISGVSLTSLLGLFAYAVITTIRLHRLRQRPRRLPRQPWQHL